MVAHAHVRAETLAQRWFNAWAASATSAQVRFVIGTMLLAMGWLADAATGGNITCLVKMKISHIWPVISDKRWAGVTPTVCISISISISIWKLTTVVAHKLETIIEQSRAILLQPLITLTTLTFVCINHGDQSDFSIRYHHRYLS